MSGQAKRSGTAIRVATAAVLLPATVAAVWWGSNAVVAALVAVVTLAALWEFFAIGQQQGLRSYRIWTALCALGLIVSQWGAANAQGFSLAGGAWLQTEAEKLPLEWLLLVFVFGLSVAVVVGKRALHEVLPSIGTSAAGLLMVALPLSYIVRLQGMGDGRMWLLFTLALVWTGDTAAYFVGRGMGRIPLAPQISPKKTWEGAVGNLFGSVLVAAAFSRWLDVGVAHLILAAVLANVAGQLGDLLESAYKRGAGVKDSGSLLPGHGGMLDRIDALIFAAPVVWAYASLVR